jgi:hypothetical protein
MITGVTRSRAAILCLGGWGLQTMLHLQSRLKSIQEQRRARNIQGADLTQVTQFASLLAGSSLGADGHVPLHLRQLRSGVELPPFYLEKLLEQFDQGHRQRVRGANGRADAPLPPVYHDPGFDLITESERRAQLLLDATTPVLSPLTWPNLMLGDYLNGDDHKRRTRLRRQEVFRAGLQQGLDIARLLETNLIAPIRQDNLVPGDPFVQTTLYVVAPMFEPMAATLIWPALVHLLNYVGRRHISQIVGIFAIGSYAEDQSRPIEDAISFAALAELEALTGLHVQAIDAMAPLFQNDGRVLPAQQEVVDAWLGRPIFDRIYLVDREKSNQGLIRNSYELSVLVSNALEAFITTDGSQYVEDQLGIDLRNVHERPYSLLGAATDYVPLDYIFDSVYQQEEKRLMREVILKPDAEEESPAANEGEAAPSLSSLGMTVEQVMAQLVAQMPNLFKNVSPKEIADLQVHPDFILPPAVAVELRNCSPIQWTARFEEELDHATRQFKQLAGSQPLDHAWGLDGLHTSGRPRNPNDRRLLPATAQQMRRHIVDLLATSPAGLRQAQQHLRQWQEALDAERQRLSGETTTGQQQMASAQQQLAMRNWWARYERALMDEPSLGKVMLRSSLLVLAVVLISALYLIAFERPFDLIVDGGTLAGVLLGAYVGGAMVYRRQLSRHRRLRRERLALAQNEMSALLQEQVQQGLVRVYDHLGQMLRQMSGAVEDATESLKGWSITGGSPPVPPVSGAATHLRRPHINGRLWDLCRRHLRSQQDREGRRGEERLRISWQSVQWRRKLEGLLVEERDERPLAAGLHHLLRDRVRSTIAELNAASATSVRAQLVRVLENECNLEHLLWRDAATRRQPRTGGGESSDTRTKMQKLIHRYLEFLWTTAKPATNYDVADRLAAHGLPVDFATVWGSKESDLSDSTLRDFRMAALPTDDPFRITFVRTIHGLTLSDLSSIHRYHRELNLLQQAELAEFTLVDRQHRLVYGVESKPAGDAERVRP